MLIVPRRKLIRPTRRKFLIGAAAFIACAPSIIRAQVPMTGAGKGAPGGGGGGGVVTIDQVGAKQYFSGTPTSASYTGITVGSGSNRALVIGGIFDSNLGATSGSCTAVWDSGGTNQSMFEIIETTTILFGIFFGLVAPTPGNKTCALAWSGAVPVFWFGMSFTGVDQTGGVTSFPASATATGVTTQNITSQTGDMVINLGSSGASLGTPTGTLNFLDTTSGTLKNVFANYDNGASPFVAIGSSTAIQSQTAIDVKHV